MQRSLPDQQHTPSQSLAGRPGPPKSDTQAPFPQPPQRMRKSKSWLWIVALLVVFLGGYLLGHKLGSSTTKTAQLVAGTATVTATTVSTQTTGSTAVSTAATGSTAVPTVSTGSTAAPTAATGSTAVPTVSTVPIVPTVSIGSIIVPSAPTASTGSTTAPATGSTTTAPATGSTTAPATGGTTAPATGSTTTSTTPAQTTQLSYAFSGTTGGDTAAFKILPNWVLLWTCDPASLSVGQANLLINVMKSDGTPIDPLAVNAICKAGNTSGLINEKQGGNMYLDIDTEGAWAVTIQQQSA